MTSCLESTQVAISNVASVLKILLNTWGILSLPLLRSKFLNRSLIRSCANLVFPSTLPHGSHPYTKVKLVLLIKLLF